MSMVSYARCTTLSQFTRTTIITYPCLWNPASSMALLNLSRDTYASAAYIHVQLLRSFNEHLNRQPEGSWMKRPVTTRQTIGVLNCNTSPSKFWAGLDWSVPNGLRTGKRALHKALLVGVTKSLRFRAIKPDTLNAPAHRALAGHSPGSARPGWPRGRGQLLCSIWCRALAAQLRLRCPRQGP